MVDDDAKDVDDAEDDDIDGVVFDDEFDSEVSQRTTRDRKKR